MELNDFLDEAEEDEMNGVKWKHNRLKSKLIEYRDINIIKITNYINYV